MEILSILWQPSKEVFTIGSFSLHWYSFFWCVGLIAAYIIVYKLYKAQGIPQRQFDPLFFYCFIGILIGARLGHCLLYEPGYFLSHPVEMFLPVRDTGTGWKCTGYAGLASHGGTLGLMIALWLYVRRTKINIFRVLDNIAIATPITACCIRLGNLMNSEIVGKYTGTDHGFIFAFRFFVEFFKDVQEAWEIQMVNTIGLNQGQLLSIPFVAIGLYCLLGGKLCKKWGEKK